MEKKSDWAGERKSDRAGERKRELEKESERMGDIQKINTNNIQFHDNCQKAKFNGI